MKRSVPLALAGLVLLAGCKEDKKEATDVPPPRPSNYYVVPEPPPPPPTPPAPERTAAPEVPQVVILQPPPPPAPPPPPFNREPQDRAAEAAARVAEARAAGPSQAIQPPPPSPGVPPPLFMDDPDWTREGAPFIDSGFPVDMKRKIPRNWVLTGVLLDPINTAIPGVARITIDSNIPCGSGTLICIQKYSVAELRYDDLKKQGETRVNVRLIRILNPNGAQIYTGDEQEGFGWGADAMGQTGLVGDIDNRIFERYGTAFLTATISALAAAAAPQAQTNTVGGTTSVATNSAQALSQQLGQITAKVLEQTINLAPVASIAAGENVTLRLTSDIYIRPPQTEKPKSKRAPNP